MRGNGCSSTKTLTEIKEKNMSYSNIVSDWFQIWMAASLIDVKVNNAIKIKKIFLANRRFSQIRSHDITYTIYIYIVPLQLFLLF